MIKKTLATIIVIILIFIGSIKVLDNIRVIQIVNEIIGDDNYRYVNKIDQRTSSFTDSYEAYVYRITNINTINCNLISNYADSVAVLDNFDKKYINLSKSLCIKKISDEHQRLVLVVMQNKILIMKILTR